MAFRQMKYELQSFVPEFNPLQCGVRLNRSYKVLLDMHQWSFLKQSALITTVPVYNAGTVTAVAGSTTVSGMGTVWLAGFAGRYIRLSTQSEYYKIISVDPIAQSIVTESAIGNGVAGSGYYIFQYHYTKPTLCKHIIGMRRQLDLCEKPQSWIDGFDPDRTGTGEPIYWSNFSDTLVEIYPPADQTYEVRVTYILDVADLTAETDTPKLPENLIINHAVFAAYRQLASRPEGKGYAGLVEMAQKEFQQAWQAAYETDLSRQTLPTQVRAGESAFPESSDFWINRDMFWAGF